MVLARTAGSKAWRQEKENEFQKQKEVCERAETRKMKFMP